MAEAPGQAKTEPGVANRNDMTTLKYSREVLFPVLLYLLYGPQYILPFSSYSSRISHISKTSFNMALVVIMTSTLEVCLAVGISIAGSSEKAEAEPLPAGAHVCLIERRDALLPCLTESQQRPFFLGPNMEFHGRPSSASW